MGEAALKLLDWGVEAALVPELVVVELVTEEVAGLVFVVPKPEVAAGGGVGNRTEETQAHSIKERCYYYIEQVKRTSRKSRKH